MARPFVFVLHHHQPPGNLPAVMAAAHERCYRPLLGALELHPNVRVVLHFSGSLLEWLVREDAAYVERIRKMVDAGRAQILGGAFYDPILSVLPDQDAAGQLEMMSMFLKRYIGVRPTGAWLAERVWDADLPRMLAPAGLTHTFVDDHHFVRAGFAPETIGAAPLTEKAGHAVRLIPISTALRYAIPFNGPDDVIRTIVEAPGNDAVVYADDAEKLGFWPDTNRWVFEDEWLERFLTALDEAQEEGRVRTVLAADVATSPPRARVYLEGGGYEAIATWAMSADAQRAFERTHERLNAAGLQDAAVPIQTGAPWSAFLAKYPEADRLHKKMLRVSERLQNEMEIAIDVSEQGRLEGDVGDLLGTAQRELYRGQSACPYWHGLFGGVYLGHLRRAAFGALIHADEILDRLQQGEDDFIAYEERDVDLDGFDEIVVANRAIEAIVSPARGGTVTQLDHKHARVDIADVLARHDEPYRETNPRSFALFADRWIPQGTAPADAEGAPIVERFDVRSLGVEESNASVRLVLGGQTATMKIEKQVMVPIEGALVDVMYSVENVANERVHGHWVVEVPNTFVGAPADADTKVIDDGAGLAVRITADGAQTFGEPLVVDARRETGVEPTVLGYLRRFAFELDLPSGERTTFSLRIAIERRTT